jgi:hypothetical protein
MENSILRFPETQIRFLVSSPATRRPPCGCFHVDLILADQTPTPTRLLNNCEELRVFDDLQNINPFEEGFRRAVEDNTSGDIRDCNLLTTTSNQDTLHTPQILPQFENRIVKREQEVDFPTQNEPENLSLPTTLEEATNIPNTSQSSESNNLKIAPKPQFPLLPKILYATPILASTAVKLAESSALDPSRSSESVKDKLKNILLSNGGPQSDSKRRKIENVPSILINAVPLVASTTNLIITSDNKMSNHASNDNTTSEVINRLNETQKTTKPPAAVLKVERNRAAARRYR